MTEVLTRRSVVVAPETSHLDDVPVRAPGSGEILVQVLMSGLCASDLPTWLRGPSDGPGVVLGHEPVGRIIEIGPGVGGLEVGALVTGRLTESFADVIVARAASAVVVPPGLKQEAALGEPLGCVVEALRRARLDSGDRVAVVGLGFMGLCLLQLLAARDVGELVALDPREDARRAAMTHGASAALDPSEPDRLHDAFDVVFEVTGTSAGLDLATSLTRAHGTLDIVGYHQGPRTVDMQAWNWKALDVVNGHVRDEARLVDSIRRGLDIVASGRVDYGALVTHRYRLAEIDRAYADLRTKPDGFVKAVIVP